MSLQVYNNPFKNLIICIDQYENRVPVGSIHGLHPDKGIAFHGMIELLNRIDLTLEEESSPQAFSARRVFGPKTEHVGAETIVATDGKGKLATLVVRILFRQNASWQGTVAWVEGKSEESFRSVLELMLLMDSAMGSL